MPAVLITRPFADFKFMGTESRFALWLRTARADSKLSQTKLGELVDLSKMQVSRLESGEQSTKPATAIRLAQALNQDPQEALDALTADALAEAGITNGLTRELDPDSIITIERYSGMGKPEQKIIDQIVEAMFERKLSRTDDE
jgi:transcriptional regulator with XRE-family HTH domain